MTSDQAASVFDPLRPRLTRIAYRMLGSVADAEDIVQEAFIRWHVLTDGGGKHSAALAAIVGYDAVVQLHENLAKIFAKHGSSSSATSTAYTARPASGRRREGSPRM